jgi:ADP-ribose pyrophosphatase
LVQQQAWKEEEMALHKRSVFEGRLFSVGVERHRLPDGRHADFEIVRHPGGAAVVPLLDGGQVVLIRQFRPAVGEMIWEIPAGRLEPGETPEQCVARELAEEAGYRAGAMERLGTMLSAVGFSDEAVHLFLARDLRPIPPSLEEDEFIEVVPMPLTEAVAMVRRGEIPDGKTQLALLLVAQTPLHFPGDSP